MLFAKLRETFNQEVWEDVLVVAGDNFAHEQRILQHQLAAVEQKVATLTDNFAYVQSKSFAQALEQQFEDHEREKARLEQKLSNLQHRIEQQDALIALAKQAENVLENWNQMGLIEKRGLPKCLLNALL